MDKSELKVEKINGNPRWVKLSAPDMPRIEKIITNIKWRWAAITRQIKKAGSIPRGLYAYWQIHKKLKAANKKLLNLARIEEAYDKEYVKKRAQVYLYQPPTTEQVVEFMKTAENAGIRFANRVAPVPKTPASSRIDIDVTEL